MAEILASLKKKGGGTDFVLIVTYDENYYGVTITATDGTITLSDTATSSGELEFNLPNEGVWTISTTIEGVVISKEIIVNNEFTTEMPSLVPEGATVLPTDDISRWLACANITDKSYTTLAEVLADRETLETLIADSNACDYMARSTTWAVAEGAVPTLTTTSSNVISSGDYSGQPAWKVFDGDNSTPWSANASYLSGGAYVGYKFDTAKNINSLGYIKRYESASSTQVWKIQGSNDNFVSDIHDLSNNFTVITASDQDRSWNYVSFNNTESYLSYRVYEISNNNNSLHPSFMELQFYEADITHNQDAMALIGKYDYCSNALIGNATWAEAIANSDYTFIEPLVPTMTDYTTPSGEVIYSSEYIISGSIQRAYMAFDKNNSSTWSSATNTYPQHIGYKFDNPTFASRLDFTRRNLSAYSSATAQIKIQGSVNGSTDWIDLTEELTQMECYTSNVVDTILFTKNFGLYRAYRIYYISGSNSNLNSTTAELQFYGRASKQVLVPLVPTMTSDTQPSGECFSSYDNSNAYLVFDGYDSTTFMGSASTATQSFGYDFGKPVFVNKATHLSQSGYGTTNPKIKIQYSDDKSTWQDASEPVSFGASANILTTIIGNINTPHRYWRVYLYGDGGVSSWNTYTVQFYQRTVQTNIVHSCANDTIYYMEDGSPVIVATTNSDGDGVLGFSSLEDKEYTFYSSVAKDPSNLSNDFSKTIRITKSEFGGTTEMYLMPDTVKTLYWYGYIDDSRIEECTTANGWAANSYGATFNTNDIRLYSASVSQIMGIGTKNAINMSDYTKLTVINNGIATAGGTYGGCGCNATKVTNTENIGSYTTAGVNKKEWDISSKTGNQYLTIADNANTRDLKILAIILE